MIKNIIFDFDGVLVESVNVKTEAFKQLYADFGENITLQVEQYHLAHGGMSRFDKIRYFHQELLNKTITEEEVSMLANQFSNIVLQKVINAPNVRGALEFLEKNSNKYQCWIVTGTPTDEIQEIVEKKKWKSFFVACYGSPKNKIHWVDYLLENVRLNPQETVFVGDAPTDLEAATHAGYHFILRKSEENNHLFTDYDGYSLDNLESLELLIQSIHS